MTTRTIYLRDIPSTDPRLKRRIHHDSMSRAFAFDTSGLEIVSKKHVRRVSTFDQLAIGSCVPNAGVGCLGTDPFFATVDRIRFTSWTQDLCQNYYRKVTRADPFEGAWEPDDTGSDGNSMAKVFRDDGVIAGWRWTFSLDDALKAGGVTPFITGIEWFNSMYDPDAEGIVRVDLRSGLAGGHEVVVDEIDVERGLVGATNSWGPTFGLGGRFYIPIPDYGTLLSRQGDVTIFTPLTEPAPTPIPDPDVDPADLEFASALRPWCDQRHIAFGNPQAARAARTWLGKREL